MKEFSTGTKGRIAKHAFEMKERVRELSPNLAQEFISEIEGRGKTYQGDSAWERFETKEQLDSELKEWLSP